MKQFLFLLIITFSTISLKAQPNDGASSTSDLDVPNFLRVYTLPSIGGYQVEVYKNNHNQYFYNPLILVEWDDFKKKLDQYKDDDENKQITVTIRMHHYYDKVYNELKMQLERDETLPNVNLSNLPYTYYVLKAKIGSEYLILNPNDVPTFSTSTKQQTIHMIKKDRNYAVSGTIKQIKNFYNTRDIDDNIIGSLYTSGFEYSSDFVKGTADFANSALIKKELFGDETLIDNVVVKSTAVDGGLSLSLGPLKLGGGAVQSKVWTENEKKRIVNRNYLSQLVSGNKSEIHVLSMGDRDRIRETETKILNYLLNTVATTVALEFQKISDKEYNLVNDQITYATLKNEQVDKLLSSKPKTEYGSKTEQSGSYGGASGSNKDEITNKASDEITWQYKGAEWIPTKVDMHILSEPQLKSSFSIDETSYNKEGKKIIEIPFIYPSVWIADNEQPNTIVDRDNPIGTILAFGGDYTKIPIGWRLCDGKPLQILGNEELYNVIGFNWGKMPNGDFNLPDLRGVFLRGVSYDSGRDPDKDNRVENGKGEKNNVGSYQEDALRKHTHEIQRGSPGDGEKLLGGNKAPLLAGTSPTESAGGEETRPKNFYVNYIIRTK